MDNTETRNLLRKAREELLQLDAGGSSDHERIERLIVDMDRQLQDDAEPVCGPDWKSPAIRTE